MSQPAPTEQPTLVHAVAATDAQATLPHDPTSTGGPLSAAPGATLVPGYELLGELGRGGMGVVYKVRHLQLNRLTALKMLLAGGHAGAADLARFQTEAQAVARLQHPNIVQVYEVGEQEGKPFFALEFCGGGSLAQRLDGAPLPPREAATLVETLARAMQAAHDHHLIHRDLKPANVLLTEEGTPKITDFGLAKKLDEAGQTHSGAILGTPSYMAPEQASGKLEEVGPSADVYALGATLYECLTSRPPFKAATVLDTMRQVVGDDPAPLRSLQPGTPRDLETICLKCLQKEIRKRYGSAQELADDLRRFLTGEPIRARPVGRMERAVKWMRRNPTLAAAGAAILTTVVVAFLLVMGSRNEAVRQADRAGRLADDMTQLARKEKAQRLQADLQAAELMQQRGHTRCEQGENAQGLLWLSRSLERILATLAADPDDDLRAQARSQEHAVRLDLALSAREVHELCSVLSHKDSVLAVAFSPDGRLAVTGGSGFGVRVWDLRKGEALGEPLSHPGEVRAVAFSADGKTILTAGSQGSRKEAGLWSPQGGRGEARLWSLASRQPLGPSLQTSSPILCAALHPDGKTVLVGRADGLAQLWDGVSGMDLGTAAAPAGSPAVHAVAFSRDGTYFATGRRGDGGAQRFVAATRQPIGQVVGEGEIHSLAFHPDGEAILLGGTKQTVQLWNAVSGKEMRKALQHHGVIRTATLSPDGRLALATDDEQTARLWDLATGLPSGGPLRHAGRVYAAAFSPDGQFFLTGEEDGAARLWRVAPGLSRGPALRAQAGVFSASYSRDDATIAAGDLEGFVYLWDANTGQSRGPVFPRQPNLFAVALSPDGRRLLAASGQADGVVRRWDPATAQEVGPALASGPIKDMVWSPDGKQLATANWSWYGNWSGVPLGVRRWDADGVPLDPYLKHNGDVWAVRYSPDGKTLLTAGGDRTARLWDAASGAPLGQPLTHPFEVWAAVFSPDGKQVLTGGRDRLARIWDVAGRQLAGKTLPHPAEIRALAVSRDGALILTGCRDGFARLWDYQTRQPLGPPLPQGGIVERVDFAPDGRQFLTAGRDGTVRQWTLPSPARGDAGQVRAWVETITGLVLDPNEALQMMDAAAWRDRRERLQRFDAGKP